MKKKTIILTAALTVLAPNLETITSNLAYAQERSTMKKWTKEDTEAFRNREIPPEEIAYREMAK